MDPSSVSWDNLKQQTLNSDFSRTFYHCLDASIQGKRKASIVAVVATAATTTTVTKRKSFKKNRPIMTPYWVSPSSQTLTTPTQPSSHFVMNPWWNALPCTSAQSMQPMQSSTVVDSPLVVTNPSVAIVHNQSAYEQSLMQQNRYVSQQQALQLQMQQQVLQQQQMFAQQIQLNTERLEREQRQKYIDQIREAQIQMQRKAAAGRNERESQEAAGKISEMREILQAQVQAQRQAATKRDEEEKDWKTAVDEDIGHDNNAAEIAVCVLSHLKRGIQ